MSRGRVVALLAAAAFIPTAAAQLAGPLADDFQSEADEKTGTSLSSGNVFELLSDPESTLRRKLELVEGARTRLAISTFFLFGHGDELTRRLIDRLEARARAGVEVRIVVDGLFSLVDPPTLWSLERAGARIAYFRHDRKEIRNHIKLLVADDRRAVVGGSNLVHEAYPFLPRTRFSRWRDLDVLVEGPAASDLAAGFARLWNSLSPGEPIVPAAAPPRAPAEAAAALPAGTGICRFLYNEPGKGSKEINEYYLLLFARARRRIVWQGNFLDPSPAVARVLVEAAGRGVEVVLLTNSVPGPYDRYLDWRRRDRFAGTPVQVRRYVDGFDHSKALLVDDEICSIGSYNHDWMSSENDTEATLVIHDPAVVALVRERIEEARARSRPWKE